MDKEVSTDIMLMLILIVTFAREINIEWEETLKDSFNEIHFLEPATFLDIQITARVIERWNSKDQPACLMRTGFP